MIDKHITKPISIDSLFADFNRFKHDDLTTAIEILTFENQFILGKEDTNQSLTRAIKQIQNSQPGTEYESALLEIVKEIKNYHLESRKEPKQRDYSTIIEHLNIQERTLEKYNAPGRQIFLAIACDYLGLSTRNAGNKEKAVAYFKKARENADKKWRGLYIDFNLGRLTGDIEMLKNAARTREEIMLDEKDRYEESDYHLFLEYKWAVKNVLSEINEKDKDYLEFQKRWTALESDCRNGHFLSEVTGKK
jgi:hypothetical protein